MQRPFLFEVTLRCRDQASATHIGSNRQFITEQILRTLETFTSWNPGAADSQSGSVIASSTKQPKSHIANRLAYLWHAPCTTPHSFRAHSLYRWRS